MKDQNTIHDSETKHEKWDRAKSLFLESLYKPDNHLRGCSHNQKCFHELMEIKDIIINHVKEMDNPYSPQIKVPFGTKNNHIEPTITTPAGEISETLMSGTLGDYYNEY